MAQIQAHPWFKQGLPDGAAAMNDTILADVASRPITYKQAPEVLAAMLRVSGQENRRAVAAIASYIL
jgi:hypothetical protein